MWTELAMIIKYDKVEEEEKKYARLLLNQLNTASGSYFLKKEIKYFLDNMADKYGNILNTMTLEQELISIKNEYLEYKTKPIKGYAKLDGIRYYNINESICLEYEMRIKKLEQKIQNLKQVPK